MNISPQTLSVLEVMLAEPTRDWYGYELSRQSGLKSGTIYPMLARLERVGWLTSRWEEAPAGMKKGPRKRVFYLTQNGVDSLAATVAEMDEQMRNVKTALGKIGSFTPAGGAA